MLYYRMVYMKIQNDLTATDSTFTAGLQTRPYVMKLFHAWK